LSEEKNAMRKGSNILIGFCLVLSSAAWGCQTTTTGTNGNANAPIVVRSDAANDNTANANRPANANLTREEHEKDRGYYEQEARRLGRKIGSGANDLWLWTKVRAALAYADDLRDITIDVDVENDVVTLTGTVPGDRQKSRAEQVAKSVEGVKSVNNGLTVSGAR
jgi:hyperosmotically inducible periplasmic protein